MLLALALTAQVLSFSAPTPAQEPARGWLGVSLVHEQDRAAPLRVVDVERGAPAERAGVREGDRLVALAGRALGSHDELVELLGELGAGRQVRLTVRRGLEVELDGRGAGASDAPRLGVHLAQGEADDAVVWVVRKAEEGWPAARAGIRDGDRLVELAGRRPRDFDELQQILARARPGQALAVTVERDLELQLGARPGDEPQPFRDRFEPAERFEPSPRERLPRAQPFEPVRPDAEQRLREEIAGLNRELRALREELASLRRALSELRGR